MTNKSAARLISRKMEFDGFHTLETVTVEPRSLKHDGWAAQMERELYGSGPVAVALLYAPETDALLFAEQFRLGAWAAGDPSPFLLECCAGFIDDGETAEDAMRREAKEESGCDVLDHEFIGKAYPSPGGSDEVFMLYCGRIAPPKAGIFGMEEEAEEIKTHVISATEAIRMLDEGKITNGATVMSLHWFARHHERLKRKWSHQ